MASQSPLDCKITLPKCWLFQQPIDIVLEINTCSVLHFVKKIRPKISRHFFQLESIRKNLKGNLVIVDILRNFSKEIFQVFSVIFYLKKVLKSEFVSNNYTQI